MRERGGGGGWKGGGEGGGKGVGRGWGGGLGSVCLGLWRASQPGLSSSLTVQDL